MFSYFWFFIYLLTFQNKHLNNLRECLELGKQSILNACNEYGISTRAIICLGKLTKYC